MPGKQRIYIIDDDKDFGLLLQSYFEKRGYHIDIFYLLQEGFDAIENDPPDMVFLDNNLPDGLGWEKITVILEQFPGVDLHLLSGYNYTNIPFSRDAKVKVWQKPVNQFELDKYFGDGRAS